MSECYCSLLRDAARLLTSAYDEALLPLGINIAQFRLLRVLSRGDALALTELGRLTDLDRSTIGRNVRVLKKMGLVAMTRGADQREARVCLSEEGCDVLKRATPLWEGVQGRMEAHLAPEVRNGLRELINAI